MGNPLETPHCEDRKYSFWNYEPVYHTADFAICTFSKGQGTEWIQRLETGDTIYFKQPKGKLLADNSADNYLLIGVTSLSHLYEVYRGLAVSKNVKSFIYTESPNDIFADIDGSYPFNYYTISPFSACVILEQLKDAFARTMESTIVYAFGHPKICVAIHHYLKNELEVPVGNLCTKPFWK